MLQVESFEPDASRTRTSCPQPASARLVAEMLRDGQANGEVRADVDSGAKADEIVAFLEGAAVVWLIDDVSLVDLYRNYFDDLCRAAPPTP